MRGRKIIKNNINCLNLKNKNVYLWDERRNILNISTKRLTE